MLHPNLRCLTKLLLDCISCWPNLGAAFRRTSISSGEVLQVIRQAAGPFWHEYPFSLPCFVASFIGALSVVLAYFTLREVRDSQLTYCTTMVISRVILDKAI